MELGAEQIPVNIGDEVKKSYLDYAMSVIIGRALPNVRDGLKPVHRRILYAMDNLENTWNKPYKKSARIVGDVIGKYHPHGDAAVYESIARMAQDFSMRYPLIDGQGNFGSLDGDPPAAMRYTEIRMSKLSEELLADIDKETVDFSPNYDGSTEEPSILPAKFPNLLINGASGIAVGMATNIPPHNLGEVIDGVIKVIENPNIAIDELMELIPGPDFPTAAILYGKEGIREAYSTGRGMIQIRANALVEKGKKGEKTSIVVTEIPYQVNKAKLVEKIAELGKENKIEGITDIRDESNREGIRIVLELKKDEMAEVVLNQLYKLTPMQVTFGIIFLAIVDNQPKILALPEILIHFIEHRKEIVTRRTVYELEKAKEEAHILEGLKIALENLDNTIKLIRSSHGPKEAKESLVKTLSLTELQAQAILDMRLQRLTSLEREKLLEKYGQTLKEIRGLEEILADEKKLMGIIIQELKEIKEKYEDRRKTEIVPEIEDISREDMIVDEDMVVTISHGGYIKRNPASIYRSQRRGGKGIVAMGTKEEDFVEDLFIASTHNYIMFFTTTGKVYWLKVYKIPQGGRTTRGKAIVNLLHLEEGEKITAFLAVREFNENRYIFMITKKGIIKKTELKAFSRPIAKGIIGIRLDKGDQLISAALTDGKKEIFTATKDGMALRFREDQIRNMGRNTRGVKGISLMEGDEVIGMEVMTEGASLLVVSENGYGKRTINNEYLLHGRRARGVRTIKTAGRNGKVVGIKQMNEDDELMIITTYGRLIRLKVKGLTLIGRVTQGVKLINLEKDEKVAGIAKVVVEE